MPGESVCDPMCGGGSIPVEVSFSMNNLVVHFCMFCTCLLWVDREFNFLSYCITGKCITRMYVIYGKENLLLL